jgi:hypothetical protein
MSGGVRVSHAFGAVEDGLHRDGRVVEVGLQDDTLMRASAAASGATRRSSTEAA